MEKISRHETIFGFPEINTDVVIRDGVEYGFAYYHPKNQEWVCFSGSWAFIWGVSKCLEAVKYDGHYNPDRAKTVDEETEICYSAFFLIDQAGETGPTGVISSAVLSEEEESKVASLKIGRGSRKLTGLTKMGERIIPPKLEFWV